MLQLRRDGVPIVGFTWDSLTGQVAGDTALREANGRLSPLGLVDLDRNIRPVGEAYRTLIAQWHEIRPVGSRCLTVCDCGVPPRGVSVARSGTHT